MPVTTPRAKLMRNSLPQNRVMRFHVSSPVLFHRVCMIAMITLRPSVSGTKMKWKYVAAANCSLDSNKASMRAPFG